jgi:hypothetical protein
MEAINSQESGKKRKHHQFDLRQLNVVARFPGCDEVLAGEVV